MAHPHRSALHGGAFIMWRPLCLSLGMYWCIKPYDNPVRGRLVIISIFERVTSTGRLSELPKVTEGNETGVCQVLTLCTGHQEPGMWGRG